MILKMTTDLVQPMVRGKLKALRRALRVRLLGEGIAWLLLLAVCAVLVSLGADYWLHLDVPLRAAMILAAVGCAGYITFRMIVLPRGHEFLSQHLLAELAIGEHDIVAPTQVGWADSSDLSSEAREALRLAEQEAGGRVDEVQPPAAEVAE